jgi:hypothetical protein
MPRPSIQRASSTSVLAGLVVATVMVRRSALTFAGSAAAKRGGSPADSGRSQRISTRAWPSVRALISSGVPIATIRPSSMIATRSHSLSASSM